MKIIEHEGDIVKVSRANATWLGVIDIIDKTPLKVTIENCIQFKDGTFDRGRKQDGQALKFAGAENILLLNLTNAKTLALNYGKAPEELIGLEITLVVEKLDRDFNGSTHGIRIK